MYSLLFMLYYLLCIQCGFVNLGYSIPGYPRFTIQGHDAMSPGFVIKEGEIIFGSPLGYISS